MLSLRLEPGQEERIRHAAALRGETLSEFVRSAATERAEATLERGAMSFDDVAGVVRGGSGQARHSGKAFTDMLAAKKPT